MDDGEDVRELERNLRALGHDPDHDMDVDDHWDWATTAAVERFQKARGLDEDGRLSRGEIVFRPGATRVGQARAQVGQQLAPGAQLAELSSTERDVTVDLDARRQSIARVGESVTVDLPTGRTARGRITDVGKVATKPSGRDQQDAEPTIAITIDLLGRDGRGTGLDQAPVDVGFAAIAARACSRCPSRRCWPARAAATRSRRSTARRTGSCRSSPGSTPRTGSRSPAICARACGW